MFKESFSMQRAFAHRLILILMAILSGAGAASAYDFQIHATYDPFQATSVSVAFELETNASVAGYFWRFGDGHYSFAASPEHTYGTGGVYEVSLEITLSNGTKVNLVEPDLVTIHNAILANDFNTPVDPTVFKPDEGAVIDQQPYGGGLALRFWAHPSIPPNQEMPNTGVEIGNDTGGSGGMDDALSVSGYFRFVTEILPSDLPHGTEFVLFRLQPSGAVIRARWFWGLLYMRAELAGKASPWQSLGNGGSSTTEGSLPSFKGRLEVELITEDGSAQTHGIDELRVAWVPLTSLTPATSWTVVTTGVLGWDTLRIGAFETTTIDSTRALGKVWIDNFERLRYGLGGNPLE